MTQKFEYGSKKSIRRNTSVSKLEYGVFKLPNKIKFRKILVKILLSLIVVPFS